MRIRKIGRGEEYMVGLARIYRPDGQECWVGHGRLCESVYEAVMNAAVETLYQYDLACEALGEDNPERLIESLRADLDTAEYRIEEAYRQLESEGGCE